VGQGCTTRIYRYDSDGNRSSLITRPPATGGGCAGEGGTVEPHRYDSADRVIDDGTVYDALGDVAALPGADAGGGNLTNTFYANSRTDNQSQEGETTAYLLDPEGRTYQTVSSGTFNATVLSHYSGPGEAVSWTVLEANGEWVRSIYGFNGLMALETNAKPEVIQIANLHGDIVATASASATATSLASTADTSEFGVPRTGDPPKTSWLGALGLRTEQPSGTVAMGARTYQPQVGRFMQADPTPGGSASTYAYLFDDPLQGNDPTGEETTPTEAAAGPSEATSLENWSGPGAVISPSPSRQLEEVPSASPAPFTQPAPTLGAVSNTKPSG
jgi:RHS repeat-associated protein